VAVLKIMNGYKRDWVEGQTALQERLRVADFKGVCYCLPLRSAAQPGRKEFVTMTGGTPACLLTFCDGQNAAKLVEDAPAAEAEAMSLRVLGAVGRGLAALHSVHLDVAKECGEPPKLRTWRQRGACLVLSHVTGEALRKMQASEFTKSHEFVTDFYPPRAAELARLMQNSDALPAGAALRLWVRG